MRIVPARANASPHGGHAHWLAACPQGRAEPKAEVPLVTHRRAPRDPSLEVDVAGDRREAVVVELPFIDPKKEIPKQRLGTAT